MIDDEIADKLRAFEASQPIRREPMNKEKKLLNAIKLLITTLNEDSDLCPDCSCKDCCRVSCKFNESELFKELHKEFPELYES